MHPRANRQKVRALAFDAYGTLFDVHSVILALKEIYPGQAERLSQIWRTKQLEYTWLLSLMGHYRDFRLVTRDALVFACRSLKVPMDPTVLDRLLKGYLKLEAYPEVSAALEALAPWPRVILSNGSPGMLAAVVENAGLSQAFSRIISVDEVGIFKPSPLVYQLVVDHLGLAPEAIGFVSANAWDACGAKAFGFWTCWLNRTGAAWEELGFAPDVTVSGLTELQEILG
jgi:2-haloacid dehalogenase